MAFANVWAMAADHLLLVQLLTLAGLLGATAEYSVLIRRRLHLRLVAERRAAQAAIEASGLHGLVRLFLADQGA